jgi:copper homeostasis protein
LSTLPYPTKVPVEVCVDSVDAALAVEAIGAARIELCADVAEGGTTPSAGMLALCSERLRIPVFAMIRPRGGDFLYSALEFEVMRRDVATARELGAAGVVVGLLEPDGMIDVERTRILVEEARPLAVTFHRAFDVCSNAAEALESLAALGIERVLTSGQDATAAAGLPLLEQLARQAAGRIRIVAAGGIREDNVREVARVAHEVHLRGGAAVPSPMRYRNPRIDFGGQPTPSDAVRVVTDVARVQRVIELARTVDTRSGK